MEDEKAKSRARYKKWYENNKDRARKLKRRNMRKYRKENPEKYRKYSRDRIAAQRESLFEMYGHVCSVCGFSDKRALTLDHILRNGNQERKEVGERGVYRKALKEFRPDIYRTLCMNCQFIQRSKPQVAATAWEILN